MFLRDNAVEELGNVQYEERQYDIDAEIAFTLLTKLYTNPKKIIPQEYLCNARDANREVENTTDKVRVVLPEYSDSNLYIRDYGPGLSKERIEKVFCTLGKSTKRSSGSQTGGFGIGAKCYFAYGNSFIVKSFVDGVLTTYASVKNGRKVTFRTVSEEETEEKNGVEVVLPVETYDISAFTMYVKETIQYWKEEEQPELFYKGEKLASPSIVNRVEVLSGASLIDKKLDGWATRLKILIDGILYPIDNAFLATKYAKKLHEFTKVEVIMDLGASDVTINPNRETIEVNEDNLEVVDLLCERVYNTILQDVSMALEQDFKSETEKFKEWLKVDTWFEVKNPTSIKRSQVNTRGCMKIKDETTHGREKMEQFNIRQKGVFDIITNVHKDSNSILYSKARQYISDNPEIDFVLVHVDNAVVSNFARKHVPAETLKKQPIHRPKQEKSERSKLGKGEIKFGRVDGKGGYINLDANEIKFFYVSREMARSGVFQKWYIMFRALPVHNNLVVLSKTSIRKIKKDPLFQHFSTIKVTEISDKILASHLRAKFKTMLEVRRRFEQYSNDKVWAEFEEKFSHLLKQGHACRLDLKGNFFVCKKLVSKIEQVEAEFRKFHRYLRNEYGLLYDMRHTGGLKKKDLKKYLTRKDV